MNEIPQDPFMLLSWVNMKLRDDYSSFESLCADLQLDAKAIEAKLNEAGFEYMESINQFR
jgi:hypothetical protein